MIVGELLIARHTETADTAFTLTAEEVALSITKPDGTSVSPSPAISVDPGSSSTTQTMEAAFVGEIAGVYRLNWAVSIGSSVLERQEVYFASWTDVSGAVRRRLTETATTFPDADLDPELAWMAREIVDRFPCLGAGGGYGGLTGLDQERFDQALGLLTAAKLRPSRVKRVPSGDVIEEKQGDEARTFSDRAKYARATVTLEESWAAEAARALTQVTCIKAAFAGRAARIKPFLMVGPTRTDFEAGRPDTPLATVLRILDATSDDGE